MSERSEQYEQEEAPMHHREITLADGRYMIFYTFDESVPPASAGGAAPEMKSTFSNSGSRPPADAGGTDLSPANTDV